MGLAVKYRYKPLRQDCDEDNDIRHGTSVIISCRFAFFAFLFVTSSAFFTGYKWATISSAESASHRFGSSVEWSTFLAELPVHSTRFEGSFEFENKFRGPPSPELDHEWARFTEHPLIDGTASLLSVSREDIEVSKKMEPDDWFNATVKYEEDHEGGFMGTLEVFHQLHCLNMIRKSIHIDYYRNVDPVFNESSQHIMNSHLDHCIEILRQVISCNADTGLILFKWVKNNPIPYPDFNTWHQCRDLEQILQWSHEREAPVHKLVDKSSLSGVVQMPHSP